ncbi:MAG TPA: hypothetical protein VNQ32_10940 [Steroidobacteraceae bacterium]|nr:hypothetical protein [Steroidobacteraceae bacterium]
MLAELQQLVERSLGGIAAEGLAARHDGISPGHEQLRRVAVRHGDLVGQRGNVRGNGREADARLEEGRAAVQAMGLHGAAEAGQCQATGAGQCGGADAGVQELAARRIDALDHLVDGFVRRRIDGHVVLRVRIALHGWLLAALLSGGTAAWRRNVTPA